MKNASRFTVPLDPGPLGNFLGQPHLAFMRDLRHPHHLVGEPSGGPSRKPAGAGKGLGMLAVATALETIAFTALSRFAGLALGLTVLGLVVLYFLLCCCGGERRQARVAQAERLWKYYLVNERLGERPHARQLGLSGPLNEATVPPARAWFPRKESRNN